MVEIRVYPEVRVWHKGHDLWEVTNEASYLWHHNGITTSMQLNAGFITDFASIPWGLWNFLPPFDSDYVEAAIIHDWLYGTHLLRKAASDLIFYETMETLKTPSWKREALYWGVRLFGDHSYDTGQDRKRLRERTIRRLLAEGL